VINKTLPPKILVYADKDMICTVLRNLITNAIKFSYPGGKINISTDEKQGLLTVSISDNGVGIPKENIDKLFRIDENYSTPGTMGESGTGLGLILCKEFIEKHGGKIWAESNCDGSDKQQEKIINGSTFYFTIPNATEKQEENILDGLLPGNKTENHG
jgi:signal transduction histidine kinase